MFNLFRRNSTKSQLKPPRAPGDTIRDKDRAELVAWVSGRGMVEGFVEPETVVNEMSIVLVDDTGDYIRRRIGGPKGIDAVARALDVPIYDVEETGYPQRMRERMKRERILRKRREQAERRKQWEQRNGDA
ncbi:oxidoreductase [Corynebacterium propinquum]|uniref:Oxidoreductase n=1 Tax=Corynebacterium propinquum TaxID=43769 RepID=A0ABT7G469_9CORY|nr:oxidoreductase [Corynebacterium propinquum]MCT1817666.1 oxidoreductase [Corynebacterium propinquum]MDK4291836.1 oxidoreductase [Corynebacterium propinquum]MDK4301258.1 oxidoreductase [Corynebacterium propinquum]MDK4313826.1 oxidoreductase [Corynebacterium propinquum]MDK4318948.1 oxidoreductase [Corynebacterium propinquum]